MTKKEKSNPVENLCWCLVGIIVMGIFWASYNTLRYGWIEEITKEKILIVCEDRSMQWFDMPKCETGK